MKISIIAAIGRNRELGKNNKLLWHIPEDLKRFKVLTQRHTVVMGRKTYESLGKPLPNRINVVVTRNSTLKVASGTTVCRSLKEAIDQANHQSSIINHPSSINEVFIIGGGQIYQQAITIADKLYLTVINAAFDADTFFPDYSAFKKKVFEEKHQGEKYTYTFVELER